MERRLKILATLLLFLLPGCGSPPAAMQTSTTGTTATDATNATTTATAGMSDFVHLNHPFATIIVLKPGQDTALRLHFDHANVQVCRGFEQDLDEPLKTSLRLWNRTGLVQFNEWTFEADKPFDQTVKLPDDPPFLIDWWAPCFGGATWLEFHATHFEVANGDGMDEDQNDPKTIFLAGARHVDAVFHFPTGGQEAMAQIDLRGKWPFLVNHGFEAIDIGPTESVEFFVYQPDKDPHGDKWNIWYRYSPADRDVDVRDFFDGKPGTYNLRAVRSVPGLEVDFTFRGRVQEFVEGNMRHWGFEYPFQLYDTAWSRYE